MKLAIIGGSGLAALAELEGVRRQVVRTPYGDPSAPLFRGSLGGIDLVFLARHGTGHTIAPHEVNYLANLWALKHAPVEGVVAVASVGGIAAGLRPGTLVIPDQIIDYTTARRNTYFEGPDQPVNHVDFTWPYDERLRDCLARAADEVGRGVVRGGTYGCAQGPRLETAAEVARMERDGCTMVGMTGMPEAVLARELGLPYATLAVVANHAAGRGDSGETVSLEAISETLEHTMGRVRKILQRTARLAAELG
ncbi:MAG TPA: S-methyl-5'-thioinosine phosphorylase [Burkholderiaceae bacterium]